MSWPGAHSSSHSLSNFGEVEARDREVARLGFGTALRTCSDPLPALLEPVLPSHSGEASVYSTLSAPDLSLSFGALYRECLGRARCLQGLWDSGL